MKPALHKKGLRHEEKAIYEAEAKKINDETCPTQKGIATFSSNFLTL